MRYFLRVKWLRPRVIKQIRRGGRSDILSVVFVVFRLRGPLWITSNVNWACDRSLEQQHLFIIDCFVRRKSVYALRWWFSSFGKNSSPKSLTGQNDLFYFSFFHQCVDENWKSTDEQSEIASGKVLSFTTLLSWENSLATSSMEDWK